MVMTILTLRTYPLDNRFSPLPTCTITLTSGTYPLENPFSILLTWTLQISPLDDRVIQLLTFKMRSTSILFACLLPPLNAPCALQMEDIPDCVHCDINFDDIALDTTLTTKQFVAEHTDGDTDMSEVRINLPILDRCDSNPGYCNNVSTLQLN